METKMHLGDLHAEFTGWIGNLLFYKDELSSLQKRLEEVVKKNNKMEIMSEVEHFQNQFIRQREVIDILKHDIRAAEKHIAINAQHNPVASAARLIESPESLQDQYDTFIKIYNELKAEFEQFLSKAL